MSTTDDLATRLRGYAEAFTKGGNIHTDLRSAADQLAAAPDLLEALQLLYAHLFGPTPDKPRHEIDDLCRAALAKATPLVATDEERT